MSTTTPTGYPECNYTENYNNINRKYNANVSDGLDIFNSAFNIFSNYVSLYIYGCICFIFLIISIVCLSVAANKLNAGCIVMYIITGLLTLMIMYKYYQIYSYKSKITEIKNKSVCLDTETKRIYKGGVAQ